MGKQILLNYFYIIKLFLYFAQLLPLYSVKREAFVTDISVCCEVGNKCSSKILIISSLQTG
jgi:hypothetical protein